MLTDLVQIRRLGEQQREDNHKFRRWLKAHNFVERKFKALAKDVENAIDCTECGNCCRVATAKVTERDIVSMSKFIGMSVPQFKRDYTQVDAEEGMVLKRDEAKGCVFLSGNLCTIYEARPSSCEYFPHVVKGEGSLVSRMWQFVDRATYCPIVYNTMEAWKEETKFKPHAR
jgi:Fe-S-cluster containining protein